jgi:hypothetical protein
MTSFQPAFTITNRMTQAITRIERARAMTPLSSLASSRLRLQKRGIPG